MGSARPQMVYSESFILHLFTLFPHTPHHSPDSDAWSSPCSLLPECLSRGPCLHPEGSAPHPTPSTWLTSVPPSALRRLLFCAQRSLFTDSLASVVLVPLAVSRWIGLGKENFVAKDIEVGKTGQRIRGGQGEMASPKQP